MGRFQYLSAASSVFVLLSIPGAPQATAGKHDALILQAGQRTLTLTLPELRSKLKTVEVQIDDPVYTDVGQAPLKFDAFRLEDVLALLPKTDGTSDEIVFQAADGYSPSVSRSLLQGHPAYLAFREHGRALSDPFRKVRQGKAMISPAPFYLIWGDGKRIGDAYPWPYQLVRIELVNFREKYARIYPVIGAAAAANSPERRGFAVFKTECIRCHSINLVGGDIGPELNMPKNVLEYWNEKTLRALIKKASSFRARSKMPDFPQLKDSDIDDLFTYFRYEMKHRPTD